MVAPTAHAPAAVPAGVGTGPVRIDLTRARRRTSPASWAWLAFALRTRGAVTIDIEPRELEAGIRLTAAAGGSFAPQMFLADAIENGAGFVTFPGRRHGVRAAAHRHQSADRGLGGPRTPRLRGLLSVLPAGLVQHGLSPILDWRLPPTAWRCSSMAASRATGGWTSAALRGVGDDFSWQVLDDGPRPVIDPARG